MPRLVDNPTRLLFFTGKGGVGKTSLACAVAVSLADRGKQVLLVSTDPASNLGQVFGLEIGDHEPTAITAAPGLFALNIDPETAAQAYRDRIVGPVRGVLPEDTVKGMEEQLSGACTTEIAAFDEFTELLTDGAATQKFDHVIFDTAPSGHTLRLLQLPTAWTNFLETNPCGASCLGPLSGLEKQRQRYSQAVEQLANREHTTVVLVAKTRWRRHCVYGSIQRLLNCPKPWPGWSGIKLHCNRATWWELTPCGRSYCRCRKSNMSH